MKLICKMDSENKNCQLCEEIKKDRKFPEEFGNVLNAIGLVLIVVVISTFFILMLNKNDNSIQLRSQFRNYEFNSKNVNLDSTTLIKDIDLKFEQLEKKLEKIEQKKADDLKYYGTLLGFILSIVGFFGFKSIHDTRQAAIEKAVFDAKKEAKEEAKEEAKKTATLSVKEQIGVLVNEETKNYLDQNLITFIEKIENDINSEFSDRILKIELELNKLIRPESYNENERPKIFNDINDELKKLNVSHEKLKNEMFDFKNDVLKKHIISELKKSDK